MFDWHSTKDHSVIPCLYVELDPLIFACSGTLKGSTASGGIPGGGDWAVSSEFGSPEDKWWGSVGPGETAP